MSVLSVWGTLLGRQKHNAEAPAGCDQPLHGLMLLWWGETMKDVVIKYSRNQEFWAGGVLWWWHEEDRDKYWRMRKDSREIVMTVWCLFLSSTIRREQQSEYRGQVLISSGYKECKITAPQEKWAPLKTIKQRYIASFYHHNCLYM